MKLKDINENTEEQRSRDKIFEVIRSLEPVYELIHGLEKGSDEHQNAMYHYKKAKDELVQLAAWL